MTELSLPFVRARADQSADVYAVLNDGKWHLRSEVSRRTGLNIRQVRDIAEHSGGRIVSGQRGYRLIDHVEVHEFTESRGRIASQIRNMTRRLAEMDRAYHQFGRARNGGSRA